MEVKNISSIDHHYEKYMGKEGGETNREEILMLVRIKSAKKNESSRTHQSAPLALKRSFFIICVRQYFEESYTETAARK